MIVLVGLVLRYKKCDELDILVLKVVFAGAFYPNYFKWGVADEELAHKEMSGHDPASTVLVG